MIAHAIFDPYSRCAICGVPARQLKVYKTKSVPVPSARGTRWRLQVDRLRPGGPYTLENTRLLCLGCNSERGAAIKTDGHVLAIMRKKWQKTFPVAQLWWLNTMPGAGGSPFRGKKHERGPE